MAEIYKSKCQACKCLIDRSAMFCGRCQGLTDEQRDKITKEKMEEEDSDG